MDDKETRCNDIVDRLRGIYRSKVNDGAGLLNGKDTFTREFPKHLIPPIQAEAADEIERLRDERDEARGLLKQCWDAAGLLDESWTGQPGQAWESPSDLVAEIESLASKASELDERDSDGETT